MAVAAGFKTSYLDKDNYPENYTHGSIRTYPNALKESKNRLDAIADDLFETNLDNIEVSFRDLKPDNGSSPEDLKKKNIHTHKALTEWLGVRKVLSANGSDQIIAGIKDPKCRFIYIFGEHTLARLRITRAMLTEILTFHQVTPDYLDFMSIFGLQSEPRDHRFSSFREQRSLRKGTNPFSVEALARSGRQYQLCFNLKGVTLKESSDPKDPTLNEYSIRPSAFYHRFDIENGNALWIVTKGRRDIQERFKELTGSKARPEDKPTNDMNHCFRASLSAHLLFCHWSMEDWRGYIKWLEFIVDNETKIAVLGSTDPGRHQRIYTAGDMQKLLMYEEMISDVISALESNSEVMNSLREFYQRLSVSQNDLKNNKDDIDDFTSELGHLVSDFKLHIARAKALVKVISNRSELVKQQRMERLNKNLENEAIVMRIITIVTLLYLPATFVSTLFSTDIIKYQVQDDIKAEGTYSHAAMMRWLQLTLPLMLLTLSIAYLAKKWAERRANKSSISSIKQIHEKRGMIRTHVADGFLDAKDWFLDATQRWTQHGRNRIMNILEPSAATLRNYIHSWGSTGTSMGLQLGNVPGQGVSNVV